MQGPENNPGIQRTLRVNDRRAGQAALVKKLKAAGYPRPEGIMPGPGGGSPMYGTKGKYITPRGKGNYPWSNFDREITRT